MVPVSVAQLHNVCARGGAKSDLVALYEHQEMHDFQNIKHTKTDKKNVSNGNLIPHCITAQADLGVSLLTTVLSMLTTSSWAQAWAYRVIILW